MNPTDTPPSALNYVLSFLLVGVAWGFTTPFIRRAAVDFNARNEQKTAQHQPSQQQRRQQQQTGGKDVASGSISGAWVTGKVLSLCRTVVNLLQTPQYTVPLLMNLTGSVWFFLFVGKHELSLTVPITNSMAFLFTVLGEWYVEGKVISKCESTRLTT
ncbi:hypothetical protein ACJ73_01795 [Blastomyces percursus]|uniref:Integral membrane protein n=1 Tax=Blastomyces percursus TaxID=1658174 RepID=A0A1J9R341_9EURO|nr:hypothetical protein ACJ73_01795 [Blastomyces percursus]